MSTMGLIAASAGRARTPELVGTQKATINGATLTINKPAGVQQGDLLIACVAAGAAAYTSLPAGWKAIQDSFSTGAPVVAYAYAGGSEPASYNFGASVSAQLGGTIMAWRRAKIGWSAQAESVNSGATLTMPGIPLGRVGGIPLAFCYCDASDANTYSTPSGWSLIDSNAGPAAVVDWAIFRGALLHGAQTSPAAVTTVTGETSNGSNGGFQFFVYPSDHNTEAAYRPSLVNIATNNLTSAATSIVISKPTGVQTGDLLYAFVAVGGGATITDAHGFTTVAEGTTNFRIARKIAGASEPSSYTFSSSASVVLSGFVIAFRRAAHDTAGAIEMGAASGGAINMSDNFNVGGNFAEVLLVASHNQNSTFSLGATGKGRFRFSLVAQDTSTSPNWALWQAGPYGDTTITAPDPAPSVNSGNAYGLMLSMLPG